MTGKYNLQWADLGLCFGAMSYQAAVNITSNNQGQLYLTKHHKTQTTTANKTCERGL